MLTGNLSNFEKEHFFNFGINLCVLCCPMCCLCAMTPVKHHSCAQLFHGRALLYCKKTSSTVLVVCRCLVQTCSESEARWHSKHFEETLNMKNAVDDLDSHALWSGVLFLVWPLHSHMFSFSISRLLFSWFHTRYLEPSTSTRNHSAKFCPKNGNDG